MKSPKKYKKPVFKRVVGIDFAIQDFGHHLRWIKPGVE